MRRDLLRSLGARALHGCSNCLKTKRVGSSNHALYASLASAATRANETPLGVQLDGWLSKVDHFLHRLASGPRMQCVQAMLMTRFLPRATTLKVRARTKQGPFLAS